MTTSTPGNPLGPFVQPPNARGSIPDMIRGRHVTLEPRDPSQSDDLYQVLGREEHASLWDYIPIGLFLAKEEFVSAFTSQTCSLPNSHRWTIILNSTQKAVGSIALLNITPEHRSAEVGYILFSPELQRTIAAAEVFYLLACLVFDSLGYRRHEWKCDNLNAPSKRAAQRLGFEFESVFRQHMIIKGRNRDTAWFSMMDIEWPAVKKGFEMWLDDSNFDEEGRQKQNLEVLRSAARSS
jgi:RimJ/RimL family protein N-acetyltransferase